MELVRGESHICGETNHGAVGDETDEGVGRDQTQAHDEGVTESLEIIFIETSVDNEEENRRDLGRTGERVLDGGVFW